MFISRESRLYICLNSSKESKFFFFFFIIIPYSPCCIEQHNFLFKIQEDAGIKKCCNINALNLCHFCVFLALIIQVEESFFSHYCLIHSFIYLFFFAHHSLIYNIFLFVLVSYYFRVLPGVGYFINKTFFSSLEPFLLFEMIFNCRILI